MARQLIEGGSASRLIIAPHVDDDVIGCGGTLGKDDVVYYLGVDPFHEVSALERKREAQAVQDIAGNSYVWTSQVERAVNHYQLADLIHAIESRIEELRPETVVLPWPSYNQDHRTTYEAAMVALRPHDRNWFVPRVLLYEEPDCWWPMLGQPFVPNYYVPIDIDRKIELYRAMPSQIRGHRSENHLLALAEVRGGAIMQPFAEAYHVLRWVG